MLTCKIFSKLASEAMDRELAPLQESALNLHMEKCPRCREFQQHLRIMRQACALLTPSPEPQDSRKEPLPEDAKESIKNKLKSLL